MYYTTVTGNILIMPTQQSIAINDLFIKGLCIQWYQRYYLVHWRPHISVCAGLWRNRPHSFVKWGPFDGVNTCILTLLALWHFDASYGRNSSKKWGPFTLSCVKRHENAVQREHCTYDWSVFGLCYMFNPSTNCVQIRLQRTYSGY